MHRLVTKLDHYEYMHVLINSTEDLRSKVFRISGPSLLVFYELYAFE
jgi:hypothetical protein